MKVIVTGGAGFLGFHLCNRLSEKFGEILVLDIDKVNPAEYPKNVRYLNTDIRDYDALKNTFKGFDLVIHGAAALPLWKRQDIFDVNVKGTRNTLEAAKANNIKRVVYVSSTAVYGVPEKHPIYEEDPLIGVGPYGESKIEAERVCEDYRRKGMCVPIARPKTFIGVGRLGVFQILYDWVKSGARIPVIGNGKNRYQLLEVEDLVDGIYLLATLAEDKVNTMFNLGAKEFGTVREDVGKMCEFAHSGAKVMGTPAFLVKPALALFEAVKLSPLYKWVYGTADKDSFVSIEKIEKIGWSPQHSNADALIKSYQWYLDHYKELSGTGITHRVAWSQGILSIFKKILSL